MFKAFAVSTLALAVGLVAAPGLSAQSVPQRLICQDGMITSTARGALACFGHGGINRQASTQAEQGRYGTYPNAGTGTTRGVYNGGVGTSTNRGIYNGGVGTSSNRGIYDGGVGTSSNRGVYDGTDANRRDDDRWDRRRHREDERARALERERERNRDRNRDDDRRDRGTVSRERSGNGGTSGMPGRYDTRR
ncbi:MAG TPA: hypothetical protein VGM82_00385 [Gemmatimonadaceae bacterium]|jgi:hypothetical protein